MARKTGSAAVNFNSRKIREQIAKLACISPLCEPCGFAEKRVPAAFKTQPPGSPYPCTSKLLGAKVVLRGETEPSVIVGCATPLGESLLQTGRRSDRYKCQGAFVVRTPLGIETTVSKSVVRERRRVREGNCPDQATYVPGTVQQMERAARKDGDHPQRGQDLPFPHRKGSSACCTFSTSHTDDLERELRDVWDGREEEQEVFLAKLRKAIPRALKPRVIVESIVDAPGAIRALRDHCWSMWQEKERQSGQTRSDYRKTVAALKKQRRKEGWAV
jgi:hypothetical protein